MKNRNFNVETKIILAVLPFIPLLIFIFTLSESYAMQRLYRTAIKGYLNHLLDMYIEDTPRYLQNLLERNGLEEAQSFVNSYKKKAVEKAFELEIGQKSRLVIFDKNSNEMYSIGGEAERGILYSELLDRLSGSTINNSEVYFFPETTEFYMIKEYIEWNWQIIAITSADDLRSELLRLRVRNIILSIGLGLFCSIVIMVFVRRLITRPLRVFYDVSEKIKRANIVCGLVSIQEMNSVH